jgi:hypothetical protein
LAAGVTDKLWGISDIVKVAEDWEGQMSRRTQAVFMILGGVGFGLLAIFLSQLSFLAYILLAVSICLILYGAYLYANESREDSN